ncbi:MAG: NAD(P)-dependent oxidoreductase [Clostridiaceae bacterium]|nr:NAD(P)-dependent oxidoreductase [Clostridiaceae bacterium]
MKKVLITGAKGFFASRFIEFYKRQYNIIALAHNDLDITDKKRTIEVIKGINPDYLVHAAAISDTGLCERNPELSLNVNVKGSINIAKACYETRTKMIFLSSDQVYNGNKDSGPYDEISIPISNNVYGKHKLEAEKNILELLDDAVILRLTWLYGLPERNKKVSSNILWNIIKTCMKNEAIKLPANEYRGITYVNDLISNFQNFFKLPGGVYNAGSENNLSTYEIGEIVFRELGLEHRVKDLLIRDIENYKEHKRDLRISNGNLREHNIYFDETKRSIAKCIKEYSFQVL